LIQGEGKIRMKLKVLGAAAVLCSFLTLSSAQGQNGIYPTVAGDRTPDGIAGTARPRGITYHGGPVLGTVPGEPVHLYLIFYGNWAGTDPGGPALMQDFASNLGGSPYWNILTTYKANGTTIQNAMTMSTYTDTGSVGANLDDAAVQTVVENAILGGHLPPDGNAIYHVLASSEVTEIGGFCTRYCGFHNHMTISGMDYPDIKYTFVGNPVHCTAQGGVADCQGDPNNITQSPNNDPGVDAMISVIAHESEEATSDPDLNAWYFGYTGQENGDKCAYTYGATHPVATVQITTLLWAAGTI
jgi:hypothetical protein